MSGDAKANDACLHCGVDLPKGTTACPGCGAPTADLFTAATVEPADRLAAIDTRQGDLFIEPPPPRFVRGAAAPADAGARWRWWLLTALLAALAGIQWLWVERERLAQQREWRPLLERGCGLLRCELPDWHEPGAFQVNARDVRAHPSVDEALLITLSFRNTAWYAQAWPQLELTLSDLDGRVVGRRRFMPEEYLGAAPRVPRLLPSQSARATLEVVDGERQVVAFAFEFR